MVYDVVILKDKKSIFDEENEDWANLLSQYLECGTRQRRFDQVATDHLSFCNWIWDNAGMDDARIRQKSHPYQNTMSSIE